MVNQEISENKKVVIVGAYGCGNIGDDAILAGMLRIFDSNVWDVTVLTAEPPRIQNIEKIHFVRQQLNLGLSWSVIRAFDIKGILSAISGADLLVIGGGALLHDLRFYNLPYFFALQCWARMWRTSVAYLHIGAGPIRTWFGKKLCQLFLSHADYISVRDEMGKDWLLRAGVKRNISVTADPAFMLTPDNGHKKWVEQVIKEENIPADFIAVTVCGWFKSEDFWRRNEKDLTRPIQRTASILDYIIKSTGKSIVFFPTVVPYDRSLAEKIAKEMKHAHRFQWLHSDYTVEVTLQLFGRARWLFGMRLHSMILSTIMKIPIFAVVYDQKVTHFLDSIGNKNRIHLDDYYDQSVFANIDSFIKKNTLNSVKQSKHSNRFKDILKADTLKLRQSLFPDRSGSIEPDA